MRGRCDRTVAAFEGVNYHVSFNFTGANLTGTDLTDTNLCEAQVQEAQLQSSILYRVTIALLLRCMCIRPKI